MSLFGAGSRKDCHTCFLKARVKFYVCLPASCAFAYYIHSLRMPKCIKEKHRALKQLMCLGVWGISLKGETSFRFWYHNYEVIQQNHVTKQSNSSSFKARLDDRRDINNKYKSSNPSSMSHVSQIPPLNVGSRNPNKSHAFHILPSKCWKLFQAANFLSSVCLGKWLVDFADWTRLQMFRWIYYKYVCHFCATLSAEVIIQMPSELGTRKGSTTPCPQQSKIKQTNKQKITGGGQKNYLTWLVNN